MRTEHATDEGARPTRLARLAAFRRASRQSGRVGGIFWLSIVVAYACALFLASIYLTGFLVWFSTLAPAATAGGLFAALFVTLFLWKVRKGRFRAAAFAGRLALAACTLTAILTGAAIYQFAERLRVTTILTQQAERARLVPIFVLCLALQVAVLGALWRALNRVGLWVALSERLSRFAGRAGPPSPSPSAPLHQTRPSAVKSRPPRAPDWRRIRARFGKDRLLSRARR